MTSLHCRQCGYVVNALEARPVDERHRPDVDRFIMWSHLLRCEARPMIPMFLQSSPQNGDRSVWRFNAPSVKPTTDLVVVWTPRALGHNNRYIGQMEVVYDFLHLRTPWHVNFLVSNDHPLVNRCRDVLAPLHLPIDIEDDLRLVTGSLREIAAAVSLIQFPGGGDS